MPEVNEVLKVDQVVSSENKPILGGEIINRQLEAQVPKGLETFLQRIERDPLQQTVTNDQNQTQLSPSTPVTPKVTLPTTRTSFIAGFKNKVTDVSHWLSVFIFREIKLKEGNVTFKPDDS